MAKKYFLLIIGILFQKNFSKEPNYNGLKQIFHNTKILNEHAKISIYSLINQLLIFTKHEKNVTSEQFAYYYFDILFFLQFIKKLKKKEKFFDKLVKDFINPYDNYFNSIEKNFYKLKEDIHNSVEIIINDLENKINNLNSFSNKDIITIIKILNKIEETVTFFFLSELPIENHENIINLFFFKNLLSKENIRPEIENNLKDKILLEPTKIINNPIYLDSLVNILKKNYEVKNSKFAKDFPDFKIYSEKNQKIYNLLTNILNKINNILNNNISELEKNINNISDFFDVLKELKNYQNIENIYYPIINKFFIIGFTKIAILIVNNENKYPLNNLDFFYTPSYIAKCLKDYENNPNHNIYIKDNENKSFFKELNVLINHLNTYRIMFIMIQNKLLFLLNDKKQHKNHTDMIEFLDIMEKIFIEYNELLIDYILMVCNDKDFVNEIFNKIKDISNYEKKLSVLLDIVMKNKKKFINIIDESDEFIHQIINNNTNIYILYNNYKKNN